MSRARRRVPVPSGSPGLHSLALAVWSGLVFALRPGEHRWDDWPSVCGDETYA